MAGAERTYQNISSQNLGRWKELIIPTIYAELEENRKYLSDDYLCIGVKEGREQAGALIAHVEQLNGDVQIISIYVLPQFRRRGIGSGLVKKLMELAAAAYRFDRTELSAEIYIKTMYALPAGLRKNYEAFLKAADFTQFYIFKKAAGRNPALCGADAKLRIYDLTDGDGVY